MLPGEVSVQLVFVIKECSAEFAKLVLLHFILANSFLVLFKFCRRVKRLLSQKHFLVVQAKIAIEEGKRCVSIIVAPTNRPGCVGGSRAFGEMLRSRILRNKRSKCRQRS